MNSIVSTIVFSRPCSILAQAHMYISGMLGCPLMCVPPDKSGFRFDTLGVAGIFGGDEAVLAMVTIHVYGSRRWLGWYNSPGSYQIAKQLGLLAKSKFRDNFSPGVHTDPAVLFESHSSKGPKFRAAYSGTIIEETSHLAALFMEECTAREGKVVEGRKSQAVGVTIADLKHVPTHQTYPRHTNACSPLFASIPISVSACTCIACGVFNDRYSFLLILLGILANGISCLVIGSGKFTFTHPNPLNGCPPGDGILASNNELVLLKGAEGAVDSITRGRFSLSFTSEHQIGWCSVLLTTQFVAQLLLIPKTSSFGQIMFVTSFGVSWIYNSLISSLGKETIERDILLNDVLKKPALTKYTFSTRTTAVVFLLLVLQPREPAEILNVLLPNATEVWSQWKETIVGRLGRKEKLEFVDTDWVLDGFTQEQRSLLQALYSDARTAYGAYVQYSTSN